MKPQTVIDRLSSMQEGKRRYREKVLARAKHDDPAKIEAQLASVNADVEALNEAIRLIGESDE